MRSPHEISFRLKQELRNLALLASPPRLRDKSAGPLAGLPAPREVADRLRTTRFAAQVVEIADQILMHRFPLLGVTIETGASIEWRRDYINQRCTEAKYFRLIPYLDTARAGDHKNIWELNRHQHLVLLAQAFLFSNRREHLDEIERQLNSWQEQNPFQRGINWSSALEVAFRAFSWLWIYHLAGDYIEPGVRKQFLESLYQHGCHIENNLSFYFSPNTHLLGEAVVLHALGRLFPAWPRARRWTQLGGDTVRRELQRQVRPDGSHFEQSTYYHVYALDMFLFHAVISQPSREHLDTLSRMADFLHTLMGARRSLAFLGDDDGGRWFHPYGARDQFGRATLAATATLLGRDDWSFSDEDLYPVAAWWLGRTEGCALRPVESRIFRESGLAVMTGPAGCAIVDGGGFGPGRAGHSHSDSLSLIVSTASGPVLADSGTFTYVGDPRERNAFRGSAAHNTIRVDGLDQAIPVGPFRWDNPPQVRVVSWSAGERQDEVLAECRYTAITHRRLVRFLNPDLLLVVDRIDGPSGEHDIEQFWHLANEQARAYLHLGSAVEPFACEHSFVFGAKQPAQCLVVKRKTTLPSIFAAAIFLVPQASVQITERGDGAAFTIMHPYHLEAQVGMAL
jgi:Heparinase II/III-like protein/Heparinase II/III N-terminus